MRSLPLGKVYTLLEPGPVVLLSTAFAGQRNVMAMSWHCMLEFEPPLIGCVVSDGNYSHGLLLQSGECVINLPGAALAEQVVGCGNTCGAGLDKFARFGLTPRPARCVGAPLIAECFASIECRVVDTTLLGKYCFFVLEAVHAWISSAAEPPQTIHHRGHGNFMVAGAQLHLPSKMK
ncbi:flavin reductase family protein [Pseudomonas sp. N040]|uniref:flavin reductase family protein n=1 Tax=Pseudomonas sp. N040 TaxID=2785325 RepID=UPI0018A32A48|nr:flavin reductase family protein [Pseudomonas sp. N040]MBF7728778.1 flavin reductase family protein [Pseudomonas sp. N040]MBW7012418.1 flavin reductase family protein [Pseudomonas sp. N040]